MRRRAIQILLLLFVVAIAVMWWRGHTLRAPAAETEARVRLLRDNLERLYEEMDLGNLPLTLECLDREHELSVKLALAQYSLAADNAARAKAIHTHLARMNNRVETISHIKSEGNAHSIIILQRARGHEAMAKIWFDFCGH